MPPRGGWPRPARRSWPGSAVTSFAVCMVESSAVADRFVQMIQATTPEVSIGTATQSSGSVDIARLLTEADAVLYEGRGRPLRDGRNS